ncbi:MAG TPA: tetratricopeptide repeat protein [Bryobacteraceae bacterium]|nr:tetratricopeptide repeat protein [Bryobacteraceae bacterium]
MLTSFLAFLSAFTAGQECQALVDRGAQAYQNRQFSGAAKDFTQALDLCPASERKALLLNLGQAQLMARQFTAALKTLHRLLTVDPRNSAALKLAADAYYFSGDDRAAERSLLDAIQVDPRDHEAMYKLGRMYYQQSRYQEARDQFLKAIRFEAGSYRAYDNLGLCYEALNEPEKAMSSFLKAIELVHNDHPDYDWAYANLANFLINRGEYRRAFDLAVEAARRNPHSPRNFYLGAKALSKLDQWETSVRWLKRSIELDPEYPEPHYLLGKVYSRQGKTQEARQEFDIFKELRGKTPSHPR